MANFGYETNGASWIGLDGGSFGGCLFTLPVNGNIASITARTIAYSANLHFKALLCSHADPSTILAVGDAQVIPTGASAWVTSTFASPYSAAAGAYILGLVCEGYLDFKCDAGDANQTHKETDNNYGTPTAPSGMTHSDEKLSIYATYTPSANTYELSASDGLKVGDSPTPYHTKQLSVSDGIKGGDSTTPYHTKQLLATDGLKGGDAPSNFGNLQNLATDGLKVGDVTSFVRKSFHLATDGLKAGDVTTAVKKLFVQALDGLKAGDSTTNRGDLQNSVTDGLKLGDLTTNRGDLQNSVTDGLKVGDTATTVLKIILTATDGVKLGETVSNFMELFPTVLDGLKLGDSAESGLGTEVHITITITQTPGSSSAIIQINKITFI
jgi:hypothetical protein